MATTPAFVGTPKAGLVQIANADASAWKTVVTGGSSGSKVMALMATSTDSSQRIIQVAITRSSVQYILGTVAVPANSGNDGTAVSVNLFNLTSLPGLPVDSDGTPYIFLSGSGDTLQVSSTTTVTTAKTVNVSAVYGDF
jgi:hypothetical protein